MLSGRLRRWYKLPLFVFSLFCFVLAITLMKDGARSLAPLVQQRLHVAGFADALGFGWLASYLVMSGSPVAATAMTFLDQGIVDRFGAYGMIVGSRMGASFIVLFIGFLYVLRGRSRLAGLSMGLLSLAVAWSIQLPAIPVGLSLLASGRLDALQLGGGARLSSLFDVVLDPLSRAFRAHLPAWAIFVAGLALILASFNLLDRCLPEMSLKESQVGGLGRFAYKPWVMFALGSLVTLISMSVSVSLGLLVPLSERGLVRRENVAPYIMGANITTFIDTLLVAVLVQNPAAFTVVLTEMLSLAVVALLVLLIRYSVYERALLRAVDLVLVRRRHLVVFMLGIFVVPLVLLAL